jgi:cysteine-rich repeat protein
MNMSLRVGQHLVRWSLLFALVCALLPGIVAAQACPADKFCFYVPPGLPVEGSHSDAETRQFDIVLSSPVRTVQGTYAVAGGGSVPYSVSPGESLRIPLTGLTGPASAYGTPEQDGVFLVADSEDLTVDHRETFGEEQYSETIKRSSIALGTRFRLGGYSLNGEGFPDAGIDAALIYAPTAATVTLTAPPGATLPFWQGSATAVYTASLAAGQTLAVRTLVGADFDGALLTSSTPVAVSSGGRGWSSAACGDDGMDGLVPVSALGREYVVRLPTGSDTQNNESRVRVIADVDGTEVRIDGALVATLEAGAAYSFQPGTLSHVRTSQPVLVWMNGSLNGCELDTVLIPPIAFAPALRSLSLDFNVLPSDQVPPAELAILIATPDVGTIRLNGAVPTFKENGVVPQRPDLSYVRFDVPVGDQNVQAGSDFQAMLASRTRPSGLLAYYNPFRIPGCGDSASDPGEGCDDGNVSGGDGCSSVCQIEPGFVCSGAPSVCVPACGDGQLTPALESCDDGNAVSGDGCSDRCRREVRITAPADASVTRESRPTVTGTADPLANLTVGLGDAIGMVTADAAGSWSFMPATALADGLRVLTVTAIDTRAGSSSAMSTLTIDSATSVSIDVPTANQLLATALPTLRGSGEAGALVQVSVDRVAIGSARVGSNGAWELVPTLPLTDGAHTLRAESVDAAGNTASAETNFRSDTMTDIQLAQPMVGEVLRSGTPELSGRGEPGARVEVRVDDRLVDTVTVDEAGGFRVMLTAPLTPGPHTVSLGTTDTVGNTASTSGTFSVLLPAPLLEIRNPPDGAHTRDPYPEFMGVATSGAHVSVSIDGVLLGTFRSSGSGSWSVGLVSPLSDGEHVLWATSTEADGSTLEDRHVFVIDSRVPLLVLDVPRHGGVMRDDTPTIAGSSEPGLTVQVSIDGVAQGSASVAADGRWALDAPVAIADGLHAARAEVSGQTGQTASTEVGFRTDTTTAIRIIAPARGATVGSPAPTIAGTAEPRGMLMISIDGVELEVIDARVDGTWFATSATPLSPGLHRVVAHAMDALGNEASDSADFRYDSSRPDGDGDGRSDASECASAPCPDSDGDGLVDPSDADDDGDGLPSAVECWSTPCRDSDRDGLADVLDSDDDDDGRPTGDELSDDGSPRDSDGDGSPDHLDADDDRDGLPTRTECPSAPCADSDEDGTPDYLDPDDDGDELPTARERVDGERVGSDPDGDGYPVWLDPDANDNRVLDGTDGLGDRDQDQLPDYLDPDHAAPPALSVTDDRITVAGGVGCSTSGHSSYDLLSTLLFVLGGLALRRRRAH